MVLVLSMVLKFLRWFYFRKTSQLSEALGEKVVSETFKGLNELSRHTSKTICCIFSSKSQIKYIKTLYLRRVARTFIFAVHVGTTFIMLRRLGFYVVYAQKRMLLLPRIYFRCYKTAKIYRSDTI